MPVFEFKYDDPDTAFDFFEKEIKPKFSENQKKRKYTLVRSDLPQESKENSISEHDARDKNISKALYEIIDDEQKAILANKRAHFALILSKNTDWKWQWCASEPISYKFLFGIGPKFSNHDKAISWLSID